MITEVENKGDELNKVLNTDEGYQEIGVLYKDPQTGKMYIRSADKLG